MNSSIAAFAKDTIRRSLHKDTKSGVFDQPRTTIATKTTPMSLPNHELYDEYNNDSFDSLEAMSDEIPVWVRGEQRWISGVNEDTTCSDLVNVLLTDDGIDSSSTGANKSFVITERWRRVEQILDNETKILQIWSAWGHAKPEVKLTLRQVDSMMANWPNANHEQDSGMGSPNGSTNSAIIRRRRHRASKSTAAWVTQAHTLHPKSQKGTIEKLMKLILEQGETIQQQLAKLRDRELQIAKIEDDRHRIREREHGKNYLLETYLKGLHEAEEKEVVTVNSDSGVHTEGATSSPEICIHDDDEVYATATNAPKYETFKGKPSHRERKLLKEHKHIKEYSDAVDNEVGACGTDTSKKLDPGDGEDKQKAEAEDTAAKIEWMEKLVVINKHLQREEELLVRLGAKIRKYESENPALGEQQIHEALGRVNANIETSNSEMKRLEDDMLIFNEKLREKTNMLEVLSKELIAIEQSENVGPTTVVEGKDLDMNNEKLAANLYSFSQYISKPNYEFNENNENRDQKQFLRHTPDHVLKMQMVAPPIIQPNTNIGLPHPSTLDLRIPPPAQYLDGTYPHAQIPIVNQKITHAPSTVVPQCHEQKPICAPIDIVASMNLLQKPDRPRFNGNVYSSSAAAVCGGSNKLGPKKLISGICNELESNSDTGLSSLGEDISHVGTLV